MRTGARRGGLIVYGGGYMEPSPRPGLPSSDLHSRHTHDHCFWLTRTPDPSQTTTPWLLFNRAPPRTPTHSPQSIDPRSLFETARRYRSSTRNPVFFRCCPQTHIGVIHHQPAPAPRSSCRDTRRVKKTPKTRCNLLVPSVPATLYIQ
jgi:hypothetical protein